MWNGESATSTCAAVEQPASLDCFFTGDFIGDQSWTTDEILVLSQHVFSPALFACSLFYFYTNKQQAHNVKLFLKGALFYLNNNKSN